MKKVLIVVLCVVIAVAAGLGGWLIASQKAGAAGEIVYPDGLKQVDSAAAIEQEQQEPQQEEQPLPAAITLP